MVGCCLDCVIDYIMVIMFAVVDGVYVLLLRLLELIDGGCLGFWVGGGTFRLWISGLLLM